MYCGNVAARIACECNLVALGRPIWSCRGRTPLAYTKLSFDFAWGDDLPVAHFSVCFLPHRHSPSATIVKLSASTVSQNDYADASTSFVNKVVVLGVTSSPSSVSLGPISKYDSATQHLAIDLSSAKQSIAKGFTVTWK
jgi:hypothetical protein